MSHVGRLLVATPLIGDPSFERTVVFVLAHSPDGAFGLVVNRPSDTSVEEVAEEWCLQASAPAVVFVGGPVSRDAVIGLAQPGDQAETHFGPVGSDLGTVDLHRPPGPGDHPWRGVRLFAGSAGWAPGQLEDEVAEGAWWPVDGGAADVLTSDPAGLWGRVLRRQPGQVAWFANHPDDPTAN